MIHEFGIPAHRAAAMASTVPNRFLGIPGSGEIAVGKDADIAVFSADFSRCYLTLYKGGIIHGPVEPGNSS